jgi:hypothetical protein
MAAVAAVLLLAGCGTATRQASTTAAQSASPASAAAVAEKLWTKWNDVYVAVSTSPAAVIDEMIPSLQAAATRLGGEIGAYRWPPALAADASTAIAALINFAADVPTNGATIGADLGAANNAVFKLNDDAIVNS